MEWDWRFLVDLQNADIGTILESFKVWLAERWGEVTIRVEAVRKVLDPVVWIVGSLLALVPGSFAIYKWWYYHESRLPLRLAEFLEKEEARLHTARNVLLKHIERPSLAKTFTAPIFLAPSLKEAMRNMKLARWWNVWALPSADKSLETALSEIEKQMEFWESQHAHYKRQEAAALLLRGAIAAGKGTAEDNKAALGYFLKALAIDESDIEALEYAAHQRRVLGELDEALADYEQLARLTNKPGAEAAEVRIRALRYQGEIYEKKFDRDDVRRNLDKGRSVWRKPWTNFPLKFAASWITPQFTRSSAVSKTSAERRTCRPTITGQQRISIMTLSSGNGIWRRLRPDGSGLRNA